MEKFAVDDLPFNAIKLFLFPSFISSFDTRLFSRLCPSPSFSTISCAVHRAETTTSRTFIPASTTGCIMPAQHVQAR